MPDNINILKTETSIQFNYNLYDNDYVVEIHYPNNNTPYHIPYILVLPFKMDESSFLSVEANNLEVNDENELLKNSLITARNLVKNLKGINAPVLIPILPSVLNGIPYYQQLSKECFSIDKNKSYYRIDLQVLNIINEVKVRLSKQAEIQEKIFLNGYSASGVFAQRFALLHPEIIETVCIGGASGSIPMPPSQLDYPLGIKDYEELTGYPFDIENYRKIKFRYYVGELEESRKTMTRFDEEGNPASMHDMSYFDRSVPSYIGYSQRQLFGRGLLERSTKQIGLLQSMGFDITQTIMMGRTHNNQNGIGVNELGEQFVNDCYQEMFIKQIRKL